MSAVSHSATASASLSMVQLLTSGGLTQPEYWGGVGRMAAARVGDAAEWLQGQVSQGQAGVRNLAFFGGVVMTVLKVY